MPTEAASPTTTSKSERINLRITRRQDELLRRAAEASDRNLTDFVMDSAVERAEQVLADRRWFTVNDEQFEDFLRLLDAPLPSTSKFDRLFSHKSQFASHDS